MNYIMLHMLVDMITLPCNHEILTYLSANLLKSKVSVEKVHKDVVVEAEQEVVACQ